MKSKQTAGKPPQPAPGYIASPELPQTDKTGAQLFHEGYRQLSRSYQILGVPPPEGADLIAVIKEKSPYMYGWLVRTILRHIVETYTSYVGDKVGVTYQQFMEFKEAERQHQAPYMETLDFKAPDFRHEAFSRAPPHYAYEPPQLVVALRNIGYDLTCGQCASVFYTGSGSYPHDPTCITKK